MNPNFTHQLFLKAKLKEEQAAMIDKTEEAEDPWYKEESDYMQVQPKMINL